MLQYAKIKDVEITKIDIKSMREKAGFSIRQIANLMDVDKAHYSRMERGIMVMPKEKYNLFLDVLKAKK